MMKSAGFDGPHQGQQVLHAGSELAKAKAVMIMVHGRGATADDILTLARELDMSGFAFLAPQASGNTWYPQSFLAPTRANEPGLSSGLQAIADILGKLKVEDFPPERVILLGFSQGGCLALEFAARNARRYGGLIGLSAGLIGPDGTLRDYRGTMDGTPVFLGCDDADFHIPKVRVHETAAVFRRLGGEVVERLYANMGHTINEDELLHVREMMKEVLKQV